MNYSAPLFLASQSPMRQTLLKQARIPFALLEQSADESACDWNQEASLVARCIAHSKMEHVILPARGDGTIFVLTADTICVDNQGKSYGKPRTHEEALSMIKLWREGSTVITAFCLDKKSLHKGNWETDSRIEESVTSTIDFDVPDKWFAEYLANTPAMTCAGAMNIEEYAHLFVRSITGSYSNILGLPLFEVRQALTRLGFFVF